MPATYKFLVSLLEKLERQNNELLNVVDKLQRESKLMAQALDNVNQALADLTLAVARIPGGIVGTPAGGATEVQTQAIADAINAQTAIINQSLPPIAVGSAQQKLVG